MLRTVQDTDNSPPYNAEQYRKHQVSWLSDQHSRLIIWKILNWNLGPKIISTSFYRYEFSIKQSFWWKATSDWFYTLACLRCTMLRDFLQGILVQRDSNLHEIILKCIYHINQSMDSNILVFKSVKNKIHTTVLYCLHFDLRWWKLCGGPNCTT